MTDRNDKKPDIGVDETIARLAELVSQSLREDADRKKARQPLYGPDGIFAGYGGYMLRHIVLWFCGVAAVLLLLVGLFIGDQELKASVLMSAFLSGAIALIASQVKTRQPPLPDDDGERGPE